MGGVFMLEVMVPEPLHMQFRNDVDRISGSDDVPISC